jgi:hypothetical protein
MLAPGKNDGLAVNFEGNAHRRLVAACGCLVQMEHAYEESPGAALLTRVMLLRVLREKKTAVKKLIAVEVLTSQSARERVVIDRGRGSQKTTI